MASAELLGILDVEAVLRDTYGLDGRVRRGEFRLLCPSPGHDDKKPSCDVELSTGYWSCWSCAAGGDIIDLGAVALGIGRASVRRMLKVNDPDLRTVGLKRRLKALRASGAPENTSRGSWYPSIPPAGSYASEPMDYMTARGFSEETCERWGVRYANRVVLEKVPDEVSELKHVVAIPVYDASGKVAMWTYRATERSDAWMRTGAKYVHTPGGPKQKLWFGEHLQRGEDEVAVTEGPMDAMWLDQCGIPAVANLGSHLKNVSANLAKIDRLCSFRKVTLFFDRDSGGITSANQIGRLLHERGLDVKVALYPRFTAGAGDPADLNPLDAQIMYWKAPSWLRWVHSDALRR
jgi:5S rRNA maturation endonuclease (ribonuclease M5)